MATNKNWHIVDELQNKGNRVTETVAALNGIHICKITKVEDRTIDKNTTDKTRLKRLLRMFTGIKYVNCYH